MWSNAEAAEDQTASSRFSIFRLVTVDTSRLSQRRFCFSNPLYEVQVWDKQEVRIRARGYLCSWTPAQTPDSSERRAPWNKEEQTDVLQPRQDPRARGVILLPSSGHFSSEI